MAMEIKYRGFTLIELIVIIAILAILAVVTLPSFIDILERNRLRQPVETLRSDLQFARTEAIKQSRAITVSKTTGAAGAWCYGISTASCDCTTAGSCSIKTVSGGQFGDVDLDSVSAADTTFDFRKGAANSGNTCFKTSNYTVKVYTNNVGRTLACTDTLGAGFSVCSSVGVAACP